MINLLEFQTLVSFLFILSRFRKPVFWLETCNLRLFGVPFGYFKLQKLFVEALGNGNMEGFFKLISYYQTQSEPA